MRRVDVRAPVLPNPPVALPANARGHTWSIDPKVLVIMGWEEWPIFFALLAASFGDISEANFFLGEGLVTESTLGLGKIEDDGPSGLLVRR